MNDRVRVRLIRKLAERIDGIYLGSRRVGDVFEVSLSEARLLIAEGWATVVSEDPSPRNRTDSGPSQSADSRLD